MFLASQPWKNLTSPSPFPRARPLSPPGVHLPGQAHPEGQDSLAGSWGEDFFPRVWQGAVLPTAENRFVLLSFAQSLLRSLTAPERPRWAPPGLGRAAGCADCVRCAQRWARSGVDSGETGAPLAAPRSPCRWGGAAHGDGAGGPGPEGHAGGSARPVVLSGFRRCDLKGCGVLGWGWGWGGGREASRRGSPPFLGGGW